MPVLSGLLLLVAVASCAAAGDRSPDPARSASPVPALTASPPAVASPVVSPVASPVASPVVSPVVGQLVKLESSGLTAVTGFRLRLDDGRLLDLRIGILDNAVEFPPGHLAEHMATGTPVRAFFRDEGGVLVVHRLEDAE